MMARATKRLRGSWARLRGPRALREIVFDAALVGAGLATAAGSIAFAAVMLAQGDHPPEIIGQKYLAIYAQPRRTARVPVSGIPGPSSTRPPPGAVDMSPVGAIGSATPTDATPSGDATIPTSASGLTLVAARPGVAWLRDGSRIVAVSPGDSAPGFGRIAAIVQRDGRWYLLGDKGAALLSSEPTATKDSPSTDGPFNRRMIFGDDK